MNILAIETSCDETAISIVNAKIGKKTPSFSVLADKTISQIKIHEKWGGVVPNLAKREHAKNLIPLLKTALDEASMLISKKRKTITKNESKINKILEREKELATELISFIQHTKVPNIDYIAVTYGPGLEPALWVGINFAKALSLAWNKPLVPINHMEGHIFSVLLEKKENTYKTKEIKYPALALLISGGHTELVLSKEPLSYKIIGSTRDDAVGEAFDKVARLLSLPYPGGPQISMLAEKASRKNNFNLPRPMMHTEDYDFSFSGLKTSVRYKVENIGKLSDEERADLADQFEEAVTDVLISKTLKALEEFKIKTLIISGGVSANNRIRRRFKEIIKNKYPNVDLLLPEKNLSTDNAVMIAIAAFMHIQKGSIKQKKEVVAVGNLTLK